MMDGSILVLIVFPSASRLNKPQLNTRWKDLETMKTIKQLWLED